MRVGLWITISLFGVLTALSVLTILASTLNGDPETLLYVAQNPTAYEINMVDIAMGTRVNYLQNVPLSGRTVWSPDHRNVAFISHVKYPDESNEIYVTNVVAQAITNLSNHPENDRSPGWSPDSAQIAFVSERDGNEEIYVVDVDGKNLHNLTNHPASDQDPQWSPDGTMIAFISQRDGNADIFVMNADGTNPRNLSHRPTYDSAPVWSPDSRMIAFISQNDNNREIYVVNVYTQQFYDQTEIPGNEYNVVWKTD